MAGIRAAAELWAGAARTRATELRTLPGRRPTELRAVTGWRAVLGTLTGRRAVLRTLTGRRPVLRTLTGRRPVLRTLSRRRPVLRTLTGRRPVLRTLSRRRPVLRTLPGRRPTELRVRTGRWRPVGLAGTAGWRAVLPAGARGRWIAPRRSPRWRGAVRRRTLRPATGRLRPPAGWRGVRRAARRGAAVRATELWGRAGWWTVRLAAVGARTPRWRGPIGLPRQPGCARTLAVGLVRATGLPILPR